MAALDASNTHCMGEGVMVARCIAAWAACEQRSAPPKYS